MKKINLDKYEKKIEESLKKGEYVKAANFQKPKELFAAAAKNYLELQKSKRITIRVNQADLIKVKARAKENNLPYQTLLNTLIRQFVMGQASIQI